MVLLTIVGLSAEKKCYLFNHLFNHLRLIVDWACDMAEVYEETAFQDLVDNVVNEMVVFSDTGFCKSDWSPTNLRICRGCKKSRGTITCASASKLCFVRRMSTDYIMPPIPPMPGAPPAGIGASGSGMSVTSASVVRIIFAMDAAFEMALLVTFAGSMIPASTISS